MASSGKFAQFNNYIDDAVTVKQGNLHCTSAGYYSSADSYIEIPTEGKWFIETFVGNRYGSYGGQGFYSQTLNKYDQVGQSVYNGGADYSAGAGVSEGLGCDLNGSKLGYYAATGTTRYNVQEPDGTTIYSTNTLLIAHALDMDNKRYWVGTGFPSTSTAWSWFGNGNTSTGTDDPATATSGLDISGWITANSIARVRFAHCPNKTSADPYCIANFGQDSTFQGNTTAGTSSDANGFGDFIFPLPSGYLGLCSGNYPEDSGFITNTTFKGSATSAGPVVFLNGVPGDVTINSNAVTWGTHAIKLACGFRLITNSSSYNSTNSNTVVATSGGATWKYGNAQYY